MALKRKFRIIKICCFMFGFVVFLHLSLSYILFKSATSKLTNNMTLPLIEGKKAKKVLENVIVHIDFKGTPVHLNYLTSLLPTLKTLGVTGLLMEYEDMFPYEDRLVNLSAKNCYKKTELRNFLSTAAGSGFDIVPLIQTFGHMEHVLKLSEFQHLREIPLFPDSICPSKIESQALVTDMLKQIIQFHLSIIPLKYFHIGCDEVYHINKCKQCKNLAYNDIETYTRHVQFVRNVVNDLNPNSVILLWDDMFRNIPMNLWNVADNNRLVETVYWDYTPSLSISHINMLKYHKKFANIWIASAFKGADGRISSFPDLLKRFNNHYKWIKFTRNYKFGGEENAYKFAGIILTGWSRYSHMDPPCDLLQVSLPSLYLNLLFIKWCNNLSNEQLLDSDVNFIFTNYIHKDLMKVLNCNDLIYLEYFDNQKCNYSGSEVYGAVQNCDNIISDIMTYYNDINVGLLSINFYSKFHYVNVNQLMNHVNWCNNTLKKLSNLEKRLKKSLHRYYDKYFADEYVNFKLYNTKIILINLYTSLKKMLNVKIWDRRPSS